MGAHSASTDLSLTGDSPGGDYALGFDQWTLRVELPDLHCALRSDS